MEGKGAIAWRRCHHLAAMGACTSISVGLLGIRSACTLRSVAAFHMPPPYHSASAVTIGPMAEAWRGHPLRNGHRIKWRGFATTPCSRTPSRLSCLNGRGNATGMFFFVAGAVRWCSTRTKDGAARAAAEKAAAVNRALIFIKPHACTPAALEFVPRFLQEKGIKVLQCGSVSATEILERGIIDAHYAELSHVGMAKDVGALDFGVIEAENFLAKYGKTLKDAIAAGEMYSAATALTALDVSPKELFELCLKANHKLKSGVYVAQLQDANGKHQYVLNGFYARLREKFVVPGVIVHWFVVSFEAGVLPWCVFRSGVIGDTNPTTAAAGTLRARFRDEWQALGLKETTSTQDNGVHASAGPLEALRERMIWLGDDPEKDPFGVAVASQGGAVPPVTDLIQNPTAEFNGRRLRIFDLLEGVDSVEALKLLNLANWPHPK